VRRIAPVLAIAALAIASLSACAPAETGKDVSCSPYRSGAASSTVTATGKVGSEPKIDFPTPLRSKTAQVSALVRGDGAQVGQGDVVQFKTTISLARTGQKLQAVGYDANGDAFWWTKQKDALAKSLVCQTAGSRIALTATAKQIFGEGALAQQGIDDSATLVLVTDIVKRFPGKADGVNQLQTPGLPAIVTAPDGQPGIVLPGDPAPKEKTTAIVKAGGGKAVRKGQKVLVQYSVFQWGDTATAGQSTWENKSPSLVPAGDDSSTYPFSPQLVGKKIGTQLIQVVPADASGAANAAPQIIVIDLLGVVS